MDQIECLCCGSRFEPTCHITRQRFCSEACRFAYGNLKRYYPMDDRRCLNCGAEVEPTLRPGLMSRFCDDKCKAAYFEKRRQEKKNGREQSRQTCPHCGKSYYPAWGQCARRFCCEDCRAAWWQAQTEPAPEDMTDACLPIPGDYCLNCGAVVEQSGERGRRRLFCCDKCRIAYHGRKHRENRRKEQRPSQICPNCGKAFQPAREHGKHRRFCCDDCRLEYWREYHAAHPGPGREALKCAHCGQAFDRKKSDGGKYCCRTCYLQAMAETHSEGICAWCGDWFPTYERLDRKHCSPRCAAAARHAPTARRGSRRVSRDPEVWREQLKAKALVADCGPKYGQRVVLVCDTFSMYPGLEGLVAIIRYQLKLNPYDGSLYVFCDHNRTMLKYLEWDGASFCISKRRAQSGSYPWPPRELGPVVEITEKEFAYLLRKSIVPFHAKGTKKH